MPAALLMETSMLTHLPTGAAPLAVSLLTLLATSTTAVAETPQALSASPSYSHAMIGTVEVTALSDGTVDLPVDELLAGTTPEAVAAVLDAAFLELPLETSDNAFLVNTGEALILVDAGAGTLFGPTLGHLMESLAAAGFEPSQVDHVVLTHMHPDHVGGLLAGAGMAFPEAIVHASQAEAEAWLDEAKLAAAPEESRPFFEGPIAALAPYIAAGRFEPIAGDVEIAPGVRSVSIPGHTDGHLGVWVESEGEALLVWGDVVHVAAVQFADPAVTIAFDSHADEAASERAALFEDAATRGYLVAGAHLPFPGWGHVRAAGDAYEWLPLPYSALR